MNAILCLAVIVAAFGSGLAQRPHDPCRTCEIIVNIARHHFNNTVNDKAALQAQLLVECQYLAQVEGQAASDHCTQVVNAKIDQIYNDMHTQKTSRQTCTDIGECAQGSMMPALKRQKRQNHNPCRTCEVIIGIAKRHFHNNFTDQGALKTQLDLECRNLANHGFTDAEVANCISLVDNNMPAIYNELVNNPTASPQKICTDLQQCTAVLKRQKRQRPHDPCRTCEIIVNIARHHFHNNITDKAALQAQLLLECQHLVQTESQAAADHCKMVVNNNIDKIYADMSTSHTARQTCQDVRECPPPSALPALKRQKRQNHNPCRTCEVIIGIAKRHFHNNFTDQGALKTQLDLECRNLANHGFTDAEVANCISLVDNNMPAIYNELVNNPTANPQKICTDLQQCTAVLKRQKRQRPHDPCRTCEIIVNIARHHFHNNITDQGALQAQLLVECQHLAQVEGQAAADHCTQIVNQNIAQIFADMSTHKTARQTCQDIKECPSKKLFNKRS